MVTNSRPMRRHNRPPRKERLRLLPVSTRSIIVFGSVSHISTTPFRKREHIRQATFAHRGVVDDGIENIEGLALAILSAMPVITCRRFDDCMRSIAAGGRPSPSSTTQALRQNPRIGAM
jgi:hypothetical protein